MFNLRIVWKVFLVAALILGGLYLFAACENKSYDPQPAKLYTERAIIGDWIRKKQIIDNIEISLSDSLIIRFRDNKIVTYESSYGIHIDVWKYLADSTEYGTIFLQGASILLRVDTISYRGLKWHLTIGDSQWIEEYEKIN